MKNTYGITSDDYEMALVMQKGVCAICKTNTSGDKGKRLSVDHNHTTGKFRGLLCDRCNRAIGLFKDDFKTLQNAIVYLIRSSADTSWDRYFISVAALVSTRSKDPSSQVGAVLVKDNTIITTGYNGFPRGCDDTNQERYKRPLKYSWMVHAEENALLNAGRQGVSTQGTTLYVTPFRPCYKCARAIVQCGVRKVVCQNIHTDEAWEKEFLVSREMFAETGIEYTEL
jgi:dCMP deaminase